jgi:hypothetical protein
LGVVLGLALLTKASGLALLALAAGALVWESWHCPERTLTQRAGFFAGHLLVMLAPVVLIAGWWFVRNVRLYGDWLGLNAFYAVLGTRDVPASLAQLWSERFAFAVGYWGNFGGLNVPLPTWVIWSLNVLAVVAALGLLGNFVRWLTAPLGTPTTRLSWLRRLWPFAWDHLTAARALAWAWPAAVLISWARWATVTWSSQGRLIFSAIPMWSAGLVLGLSALRAPAAPRHRGARAFSLLGGAPVVILLSLSVIALPLWIVPAYRPPASTVASPTALGLTPLEATFGNMLYLAGYHLDDEATQPGSAVTLTLMWRALAPSPVHHSIYIHLLGEGDRIVAQRDSFPGGGLLPTTILEPGRTWVERHVINLPATAYAPDTLTVAVGVYETATGARLARAVTGAPEPIRFGDVALVASQPDATLNPVRVAFGEGIVLSGYDLSDVVVEPGGVIALDLRWTCTGPVDADYTISVQLIDSWWRKVAQSDAWPRNGEAPTSTWQREQVVEERRMLAIAPEAEPGSYELRVAVYAVDETGALQHLPALLRKGTMPAQAVVLTSIRVR